MQIDKPILEIASKTNVQKALFKSLITFYGSIATITLSVVYFVLGEWIKGLIYSVAFVGMCLMCLSFSSQYKMFKFLSLFGGKINDKKN